MIEKAKNLLLNARGYKSDKKLIVIESDDWGSVRMPSKQSYLNLLEEGIRVDKCGYNSFDNLETVDDMNALLENFNSIKTLTGKRPVLTANTIVANPDYDAIKKDRFQKYSYETFQTSYLRYQGNTDTLNIIKEGIKENLYYPQLHGREHIYLNNWMKALQNDHRETKIAFHNNVYGLSTTITKDVRKSYLTALDFDSVDEILDHEKVLYEASTIFHNSFGFKSKTFIPPNYTWHPLHEPVFQKIGIKYIQGARAQKSPSVQGYKTIKHFMGKKSNIGLFYFIRNSAFEPSTKKNIDWRKKIIGEAKAAFLLKTPLIISTHRVNFMGGIVESNRTDNLKLFKSILIDLIRIYPEVEFICSAELGRRMAQNSIL